MARTQVLTHLRKPRITSSLITRTGGKLAVNQDEFCSKYGLSREKGDQNDQLSPKAYRGLLHAD